MAGGIEPGSELPPKRTDIAITVGHKDSHGDGGPVTVAAIDDCRGIFIDGPISFSVDEILERDVDRTLDEAGVLTSSSLRTSIMIRFGSSSSSFRMALAVTKPQSSGMLESILLITAVIAGSGEAA